MRSANHARNTEREQTNNRELCKREAAPMNRRFRAFSALESVALLLTTAGLGVLTTAYFAPPQAALFGKAMLTASAPQQSPAVTGANEAEDDEALDSPLLPAIENLIRPPADSPAAPPSHSSPPQSGAAPAGQDEWAQPMDGGAAIEHFIWDPAQIGHEPYDPAAGTVVMPDLQWVRIDDDTAEPQIRYFTDDAPVAGFSNIHGYVHASSMIQAYFDGASTRVLPLYANGTSQTWEWSLELKQWGFEGYAVQAAETLPSDGLMGPDRLEFHRGDMIEWYRADADGLEHGFTVRQRPYFPAQDASANDVDETFADTTDPVAAADRLERDAAGNWYSQRNLASDGGIGIPAEADLVPPLDIVLRYRGELIPEVRAGGRGLVFRDSTGTAVLTYDKLLVHDASGAELPAWMSLRDDCVVISVDDRNAVYPIHVDPIIAGSRQVFGTGSDQHGMGYSIGYHGNSMIIGAPFASNGNGILYFYRRNNNIWQFEGTFLLAIESDANLGFSVDIFDDGNGEATAIAGAPNWNSGRGRVDVFRRVNNSWVYTHTLTHPSPNSQDFWGYSVAMDAHTVFIGAFADDYSTYTDGGGVFMYRRANTNALYQYLNVFGTTPNNNFSNIGIRVTTLKGNNGNLFVTGATGLAASGSSGTGRGLLVRTTNNWTGMSYVELPSPTGSNYQFGRGVAICDTSVSGEIRIAVGGNGGATGNPVRIWQGQAFSGTPSLLQEIDSNFGGLFGRQIVISRDVLAISLERFVQNGNSEAGAVHFYTWNSGQYRSRNIIFGSGQAFGQFGIASVLTNDRLYVGESGFDASGNTNNGRTYQFSWGSDCNGDDLVDNSSMADCNNAGESDYCEIANNWWPDYNSNGVPDNCDLTGATDCNGDLVLDSAQVASGGRTGLTAQLYNGITLSGTTRFSRIDSNVNYLGGLIHPVLGSENFSVRWSGTVQPTATGDWTFYTTTDDGVRLWVNGQLLVDRWNPQGWTTWQGTLRLLANVRYKIVMEYFEQSGSEGAVLEWSGPGRPRQVIPTDRLRPAVDCNQDNVIDSCQSSDPDNDGFSSNCNDNCPAVPNNQENSDTDAFGNACDNCIYVNNPGQENADGDQFGDACDNCVYVPNNDQADANSNGIGDACEGDLVYIAEELARPRDQNGNELTVDPARCQFSNTSANGPWSDTTVRAFRHQMGTSSNTADDRWFLEVQSPTSGPVLHVRWRNSADQVVAVRSYLVVNSVRSGPYIAAVRYFPNYGATTVRINNNFGLAIRPSLELDFPNPAPDNTCDVDSQPYIRVNGTGTNRVLSFNDACINVSNSDTARRVILVYSANAGAGPLIGFEVLTIQNITPLVTPVPIGRRLMPPAEADESRANIIFNTSETGDAVAWQSNLQPESTDIYPIRTSSTFADDFTVAWFRQSQITQYRSDPPSQVSLGNWPASVTQHFTRWPTPPLDAPAQKYLVDGTGDFGLDLRTGGGSAVYSNPQILHQQRFSPNDPAPPNATISAGTNTLTVLNPGWVILKLDCNGATGCPSNRVAVEILQCLDRLDSVDDPAVPGVDVVYGGAPLDWPVGCSVEQFGHHAADTPKYRYGMVRSGRMYDPNLYGPNLNGEFGQIIPVNVPDAQGDLQVWYFQRGRDTSNGNYARDLWFPHHTFVYHPQFPTVDRAPIIIASRLGAGPGGVGFGDYGPAATFYRGGSRTSGTNIIGYNPNDEHASMHQVGLERHVFAVRDDNPWNAPSGHPNVIVQYPDAGAGVAAQFTASTNVILAENFDEIAPTTEITIEFWQKRQMPAGQSSTFLVQGVQQNPLINVHAPWSDGVVYFDFGTNSAGRITYAPPAGTDFTQWNHFAFVASQSGNYRRIYHNGVQVRNLSGMAVYTPADRNLRLGNNNFVGELDEVRVWNVARSPEDIAAYYNRTVDPNTPGLILYYNFNNLSGGQVLFDSSRNLKHAVRGTSAEPEPTADVEMTNSTVPIVQQSGLVRARVHSVIGEYPPDYTFTFTDRYSVGEDGTVTARALKAGLAVDPVLFPLNADVPRDPAPCAGGMQIPVVIENPETSGLWKDRRNMVWMRSDLPGVVRTHEAWLEPLDNDTACQPWRPDAQGNPTPITFDGVWPFHGDDCGSDGDAYCAEDKDIGTSIDESPACSSEIIWDEVNAALIDPRFEVRVPYNYAQFGSPELTAAPPHLVDGKYAVAGFPDDRFGLSSGELWFKGIMSDRDYGFLTSPELWGGGPPPAQYVAAMNDLRDRSRLQVTLPRNDPNHPSNDPNFKSHVSLTGPNVQPGYLTIARNNRIGCQPAVELEVWYANCPPAQPTIEGFVTKCPFGEIVVVQVTHDAGGTPENLAYHWQYRDFGGDWQDLPVAPGMEIGLRELTITGPETLADRDYRVRYRGIQGCPCDANNPCATDWPYPSSSDASWDQISPWSNPVTVQGWLKRLVGGLNPFDTRVTDFHSGADSVGFLTILEQAGPPTDPDVILSCDGDNLNSIGLINAYETAAEKVKQFTIYQSPGTPGQNLALQFITGRIADLYKMLGDEAAADAADPTIGVDTTIPNDPVGVPSSLFCFEGIVASPLEEELALLRGLSPPPHQQAYPIFNRLRWNFGINLRGETAYTNNYNITFQNDDGVIDALDAEIMYPQGHGDAWGHYLSGTKRYYELLRNDHFSWIVATETIPATGGVNQQVSYMHERRFADLLAEKARVGAEIVNLTFRDKYNGSVAADASYPDTANPDRAWGMQDWAQRAGQGAYFDWAVATALLDDDDSENEGIERVDRGTVPALQQIVSAYGRMQQLLDNAGAGLNPLGLSTNVVPFGIDAPNPNNPNESGRLSHYEQVRCWALTQVQNAKSLFDYANDVNRRIRNNQDSYGDFQVNVLFEDMDYTQRLIELFGRPYPEDIGFPGAAYPAGYTGPDIFHFDYVDPSPILTELGINPSAQTTTITRTYTDRSGLVTSYDPNNPTVTFTTSTVPFNVSTVGLGLLKPSTWTSSRLEMGEIQIARSQLIQAFGELLRSIQNYEQKVLDLEAEFHRWQDLTQFNDEVLELQETYRTNAIALRTSIGAAKLAALGLRTGAMFAKDTMDAAAESIVTHFGTSTDAGAPVKGALKIISANLKNILLVAANAAEGVEIGLQTALDGLAYQLEVDVTRQTNNFEELQQIRTIEAIARELPALRTEMLLHQESINQAAGRYQQALGQAARLLDERTARRKVNAGTATEFRHRDFTYRIFRNESLQKYREMFDMAARYVYLAAKAFDYETGLLGNDPNGAAGFLASVVKQRSLGVVPANANCNSPLPFAVSPNGLADLLANLDQRFFAYRQNRFVGNFQPRVFSLRTQLLRVAPSDHENWRRALSRFIVPDINARQEYRLYASPLQGFSGANPGLLIPFATTITEGLNFFGLDVNGPDFPSDRQAVKFRTFQIYLPNLPANLNPTVDVYLLPVGADVMRAPTNQQGIAPVRVWNIIDQALPIPFSVGEQAYAQQDWQPWDTWSESGTNGNSGLAGRRRLLPSITACDPVSGVCDVSNSLFNRSVWNTRWVLLIPGSSLANQGTPAEALQHFIYGPSGQGGVSDIQLRIDAVGYNFNTGLLGGEDEPDGGSEQEFDGED